MTHWIEFFRIATLARPKALNFSVGPQAVIVDDMVMLSLPNGHPYGITSEAVEWLQEQESAS